MDAGGRVVSIFNGHQFAQYCCRKISGSEASHATLLEQIVAMMVSAEGKNSIQGVMRYVVTAGRQDKPAMQAAIFEGIAKGLQNKNLS